MLNAIYDIRQSDPDQKSSVLADISHTLAMLYYVLNDTDKVGQTLNSQLNVLI